MEWLIFCNGRVTNLSELCCWILIRFGLQFFIRNVGTLQINLVSTPPSPFLWIFLEAINLNVLWNRGPLFSIDITLLDLLSISQAHQMLKLQTLNAAAQLQFRELPFSSTLCWHPTKWFEWIRGGEGGWRYLFLFNRWLNCFSNTDCSQSFRY